MGKETRLFKSEERQSRAEVVNFLRQLADKVAEGQVSLSQGAQAISLELPQRLVLEVQVEDEQTSRGIQHSLEVEISWYDDDTAGGSLQLG